MEPVATASQWSTGWVGDALTRELHGLDGFRAFGTMYMSVARSVVVGNLTGWWFQMVSTYTPCWKTLSVFFSPFENLWYISFQGIGSTDQCTSNSANSFFASDQRLRWPLAPNAYSDFLVPLITLQSSRGALQKPGDQGRSDAKSGASGGAILPLSGL